MPTQLVKDFLDKQHVKYTLISHSPSFTAQEVASSVHISGKEIAKSVIIKVGNQLAIAVVPANEHVNFGILKELTGMSVDLASESEFKNKFPECEVGAMPPFGNLYHMQVFVSNELSDKEQIIFNAGSHTELMKMAYQDFERLVNPKEMTTH